MKIITKKGKMEIELFVSNDFTKDEKEMIKRDIENMKNNKELMNYLEKFMYFFDTNPNRMYILKNNVIFDNIGSISVY